MYVPITSIQSFGSKLASSDSNLEPSSTDHQPGFYGGCDYDLLKMMQFSGSGDHAAVTL